MVPELYALNLFLLTSNSARFGCWISKWCLRLYSLGTETAFRQIKHSTFEFTTVNKYLFVHFELNTLPSLLIFLFLFSVVVVCIDGQYRGTGIAVLAWYRYRRYFLWYRYRGTLVFFGGTGTLVLFYYLVGILRT